ncbi:hypothetical protein HNR06_005335 [Nocardiopsis arvandica]|uniref:Uncharacterized protein n=1 Tax=Nocardiopsis sinuspersici TaxID=501010 RepID=A0A7Y9XH75_9ACTN|nr:hypothetical protein [Nocardiopsis sinuspersici]NYH55746.1 hypothetical protein [Nocardiopsis sinuspersici]
MNTSRPGRLALARMRALGIVPRDHDALALSAISGSAHLAGRAVVDATHEGHPVQLLSWWEGHEPSLESGSGVTHRCAPPIDMAVFATCLGCCWTDPLDDPWPGVSVERRTVVATVGAVRGDPELGLKSRYLSALDRLAQARWVESAGPLVRLGPRVKAWGQNQTDIMRTVFDQLPHPAPEDSPAQGDAHTPKEQPPEKPAASEEQPL